VLIRNRSSAQRIIVLALAIGAAPPPLIASEQAGSSQRAQLPTSTLLSDRRDFVTHRG
jgi:hypothetical protein